MKKFELHLDAIVVVVVVFALAVAFLLYQRHQYSIVMQENLDLVWENSELEVNLALMTSRWSSCKSAIESIEESNAKDEAPAVLQ